MANRHWVGGTANWDATAGTKWALTSGGVGGQAVPTSADDVFFDAASGAVTVTSTVGTSCLSINFTGFTGTFAGSTTFHIGGNVTLGSGMTTTFTGNFSVEATATLTSNGKTWLGTLNLGLNSTTYTLFDSWTVANFSGGSNIILNGNTLNITGNLTAPTISGTTNLALTGTGTWSGSGTIKNNLTINTAGTITVSGTVGFNTGTLTYVSGTITLTGSTLTIAASTTLNTSGIIWNNINFTANSTITLLSDLVSIGTVSHFTGGTITFNNFNFYIGGSITLSNGRVFNGTTKIIFNTSTSQNISVDSAYLGGIRNNLDINATGTVNINWLSYGGGTLTYIAGNVTFSGSENLAINASCTLNVSGINWRNISTAGTTITLASDLTCENTFNIANGSLIVNGSTLYCKGSLIFSSGGGNSVSGTTNIEFTGSASGTWMSNTTNNAWRNNVTINKSGGTLTIGTLLAYNTGTLTHVAGTVDATNSTLIVGASATLNTNGIFWDNINLVGTPITINSLLSATSIVMNAGASYVITGTNGFTCNNLTFIPNAARSLTLKNGITYTVNSSLTLTGTSGSKITIQSDTTSYAFFNLNPAATQNVTDTNATWINSSGGQTINTSVGTLSNAVNWGIASGNFLLMF